MSIMHRVKKLERLSSASKDTDLCIYIGDFEDDGYVLECHNGEERIITVAEFEVIKAASKKLGDKWIEVDPEEEGLEFA